MSKILLENNIFITADLKALTTRVPKTFTPTEDTSSFEVKKQLSKNLNWKQELEDRLNANRAVTQDLKKSPTQIKEEFWKDCFTTLWPEDIYEYLNSLGDLFKQDLLTWGFIKQKNPMVAFLNQKFVQNKLLKTKKLNINTYKALHNAIVKKLISFEEYFKNNNYNLLYCIALYDLLPADIYKYLTLQAKVLSSTLGSYDIKTQLKNKQIFMKVEALSTLEISKGVQKQLKIPNKTIAAVKLSDMELNSLEFVQEILKQLGVNESNPKNPKKQEATDDDVSAIAAKLTGVPEAYALLIYLSGATESAEVAKFMADHQDILQNCKIPTKAVKEISKILKNKTLSTRKIDSLLNFISQILSKS
jgi:hypothetical protein